MATCPPFEGFEKRLEIKFVASKGCPEKGLRSLTVSDLDEILSTAQCNIVSALGNALFDSYVLSESSLFIYPSKMVIKTCGTTQLLKSIPPLLGVAGRLSLRASECRYSRGTFLFPAAQLFPHRSFTEEIRFLDDHFPTLTSSSYIMGDESAKIRWHVYSAVADKHPCASPCYTLEVCMMDLDRGVAQHFFKRRGQTETAKNMTVSSGIHNLLPNSEICDFAFDPCGYSMNSIELGGYSTIHITPEKGYSYASFEVMGYEPRSLDLQHLLNRAAATFNPATLSLSLYVDHSHSRQQRNSWHVSAYPQGYQCESTSRRELPAGGVLVFHTFSNQSSGAGRVPLALFPQEEEEEEEEEGASYGFSTSISSKRSMSYRMCCGLNAVQPDVVIMSSTPSATTAAAVDMGSRKY